MYGHEDAGHCIGVYRPVCLCVSAPLHVKQQQQQQQGQAASEEPCIMSRKHSLEHFNLLLCVSLAVFSASGRQEWKSASHNVSEWMRERGVVRGWWASISEWWASQPLLPAFKPSQKSLLFNPLCSPLSFLSIILKYLAKKKSSYVIFSNKCIYQKVLLLS